MQVAAKELQLLHTWNIPSHTFLQHLPKTVRIALCTRFLMLLSFWTEFQSVSVALRVQACLLSGLPASLLDRFEHYLAHSFDFRVFCMQQ